LNLISSKNVVSNTFSQNLETKGFQKESILKMSSMVMELTYILLSFFRKPNRRKIIILTP
jgi:hypothetical protein